MDLECNLVESCVKATDRDIFSLHMIEIVFEQHCTGAWVHDFANFSKFYDNFSSRNNVKGAIVARCLNVYDLRNLLNIKHKNLEGPKHVEAIVCTSKFLMQAHFRETGHRKTSQLRNYVS